MYDVNKTVLNIKKAAKEKNISTTVMLENLGLNKNTLSSMSGRGSWVKSDTLAKIADYLDVSVDYLLGRDVPYDNRPEFSTKIKSKSAILLTGNKKEGFKVKKVPVGDRDTIKERINQLSDSQIDRLEGYLSALEEEEE